MLRAAEPPGRPRVPWSRCGRRYVIPVRRGRTLAPHAGSCTTSRAAPGRSSSSPPTRSSWGTCCGALADEGREVLAVRAGADRHASSPRRGFRAAHASAVPPTVSRPGRRYARTVEGEVRAIGVPGPDRAARRPVTRCCSRRPARPSVAPSFWSPVSARSSSAVRCRGKNGSAQGGRFVRRLVQSGIVPPLGLGSRVPGMHPHHRRHRRSPVDCGRSLHFQRASRHPARDLRSGRRRHAGAPR